MTPAMSPIYFSIEKGSKAHYYDLASLIIDLNLVYGVMGITFSAGTLGRLSVKTSTGSTLPGGYTGVSTSASL